MDINEKLYLIQLVEPVSEVSYKIIDEEMWSWLRERPVPGLQRDTPENIKRLYWEKHGSQGDIKECVPFLMRGEEEIGKIEFLIHTKEEGHCKSFVNLTDLRKYLQEKKIEIYFSHTVFDEKILEKAAM